MLKKLATIKHNKDSLFKFTNRRNRFSCEYSMSNLMTFNYLKEIKNIHCYCNILFLSLYLYFLIGLSLRKTSNAFEPFKDENRNYESLLNWFKGLVHTKYTVICEINIG